MALKTPVRRTFCFVRFVPDILEENDYELLYVVNFFRPLTVTVAEAVEVMREIEGACGLRFTGIVNNSNLGAETTADLVKSTYGKAEELCRETGVPLFAVTAEASVAADGMVPLKLQKRPFEM